MNLLWAEGVTFYQNLLRFIFPAPPLPNSTCAECWNMLCWLVLWRSGGTSSSRAPSPYSRRVKVQVIPSGLLLPAVLHLFSNSYLRPFLLMKFSPAGPQFVKFWALPIDRKLNLKNMVFSGRKPVLRKSVKCWHLYSGHFSLLTSITGQFCVLMILETQRHANNWQTNILLTFMRCLPRIPAGQKH